MSSIVSQPEIYFSRFVRSGDPLLQELEAELGRLAAHNRTLQQELSHAVSERARRRVAEFLPGTPLRRRRMTPPVRFPD
mgnify:CR=1 FL=1